MRVIYCGFFIDAGELERFFEPKLARAIELPHITTAFRPNGNELHEDLLGANIRVRVCGYGNDGRNEGVRVELVDGSERAKTVFGSVALPHITISVAEDAKPVDTAKLDFEPIENGTILQARFGWFCGDDGVYFGRI